MSKNMIVPTIIMAVLAIILTLLAYNKGQQHTEGLKSGWQMTLDVLPMLIFAFIVAGMVQILIPKELVANWIGADSGLKGILIGSIAGGLTPGGPYVSLPIVLGLYKSGAGIGTTVAFVTGWSLWAIARLPLEIGILGPKFTLIRFVSTMIFPILAGLIAHIFFSNWWNASFNG